ncbi:outer membrane lipoprotein chaperone LolA [soil metagenome]
MKKTLYLIALLFFSVTTAFASSTDAVNKLESVLGTTKTMQANFSQALTNGKGKNLQNSNGTMAIQRPGRFRWTITNPNKQVLIADGRYLWVYDQDLSQVTRKNLQQALGNTPALLLSGSTHSLAQDFNIKVLIDNAQTQAFLLTPKSQDTLFKSIQIDFARNALRRMVLLDNLGQISTLRFSQARNNIALSPNLFRFKPGRGVDVIQE